MAFGNRELRHLYTFGGLFLPRHEGATPLRIETQPVIAAFDLAVDDLARRQRHQPVRTPVFERRDLAVGAAPQDDRLVQDRPGEEFFRDFMGMCRHVPAVFRIHRTFLGHLPKFSHEGSA